MEDFKLAGAILGMLALFLTIVFQFPKLLGTIYSLANRFYLRLKRIPVVFREWRWWRKYCPSWTITNVGQVTITRDDGGVRIELPIGVEYLSRDDRYSTRVDCRTTLLYMSNTGKGRDKGPYGLASNINLEVWDLLPGESKRKEYNFRCFEEGIPLVGESTYCTIVNIGRAQVKKLGEPRKLKRSNMFPVDVSWQI